MYDEHTFEALMSELNQYTWYKISVVAEFNNAAASAAAHAHAQTLGELGQMREVAWA